MVRPTDEILFGRVEHGGTVHVGFDGEKLSFSYDSAPPPGETPPGETPPGETPPAAPETPIVPA